MDGWVPITPAQGWGTGFTAPSAAPQFGGFTGLPPGFNPMPPAAPSPAPVLPAPPSTTPSPIGGSSPGPAAPLVGATFGSGDNAGNIGDANQAAQIAYMRTYYEWLQRHGDEELAFQKAQQAALEAYRNATVGISAAQTMAQLRGPSNAFSYVDSLYGLSRISGLPNALEALRGNYQPPAFQAPQGQFEPMTLATLTQQLGGAQPVPGAGATPAAGTTPAAPTTPAAGTSTTPVTSGGVPGTPIVGAGPPPPATTLPMQQQAQQWLANLPAPNQIVGRNFLRLSPATQQLSLAAYEKRGMYPEDVAEQIKQGLPQFQAPAFGSVGR